MVGLAASADLVAGEPGAVDRQPAAVAFGIGILVGRHPMLRARFPVFREVGKRQAFGSVFLADEPPVRRLAFIPRQGGAALEWPARDGQQ